MQSGDNMLNFRKLKQDYSSTMLKEGKQLYDKQMVVSAKITKLEANAIRLNCRVMGSFENNYQCEVEIDRQESTTIDSDCDCPYKYDCQHLACALYYLEEHLNAILVEYSKDSNVEKKNNIDEREKKLLQDTIKEAENKETIRRGKKCQKELLQEYMSSSHVLGLSPFFHSEEGLVPDKAELALIFASSPTQVGKEHLANFEIQVALRLPYRSKPLNIPNAKEFFDALRYQEPVYIGSKRHFFTMGSFDPKSASLLQMLLDHANYTDSIEERQLRTVTIDTESFGAILSQAYTMAVNTNRSRIESTDTETPHAPLPCLYKGSLEEPLCFSNVCCTLNFELEYLDAHAAKILLKPSVLLNSNEKIELEEARFLPCVDPGMIHKSVYYRFQPLIKRKHLRNLNTLRSITIPEPLFGTFVENALPELLRFGEVSNRKIIDRFVTLPFVEDLKAECNINYLIGELEASLTFIYDKHRVPAAPIHVSIDHIMPFVTDDGILARNLTEEQQMIKDLFQDFTFDPQQGLYITKLDKKIVEFMTEVIPRNQHKVKFNCPENLLDQFIYDDTTFKLSLKETERIDLYEVDLEVSGHLSGVSIDSLWECLTIRKPFLELSKKSSAKKKTLTDTSPKAQKILVLDLDKLADIVQIFDEIGVHTLDNHIENRPLWSLSNIDAEQFKNLPIEFSISDRLLEIQQQMLGKLPVPASSIPKTIAAELRHYQVEGVNWLERLRHMYLNGILADDMGLGKTLQAIIALTQHKELYPDSINIVVCPTSLVYNWKAEFQKFNPLLRVLPVDGTPPQRKKLLNSINNFDVIITSYSLLQKDIDFYKKIPFSYTILDEAQHIKNRTTRNAKSVKMIQATHRLILTGTPIENSLDELWSLFDFLMPGLLGNYERFQEKYVRNLSQGNSLESLRKKVAPFILRRMKKDVLSELPPITEIIYHCHLSEVQRQLYNSYAQSAREELTQLVKKEGFDRVQIHVLATLTRLKQICCHPAIFAKDEVVAGDSAKYDMLLELLQTLIEGNHKTVIFSQYTRMLKIMRDDFIKLGIKFAYLDGSSKNRLDIVNQFNQDDQITVFLVSLKAGGTGLNLSSADTVIHYDIWWNPAVESQATDRLHRLGQKRSVSACKLITKDTIEEKIVEVQQAKRGLDKSVITSNDEVIAKLTWEEVLELLQT